MVPLIAAGAALTAAGLLGSKGRNRTMDTTSTSAPWGPTQPAWQQGIGTMKDWAAQGPSGGQQEAWKNIGSFTDPNTFMAGKNPWMAPVVGGMRRDYWNTVNANRGTSQGAGRGLGSNVVLNNQMNTGLLGENIGKLYMQDFAQRQGMLPQILSMYGSNVSAQENYTAAKNQMLADFLAKTGGGTTTNQTPYYQPGWGQALIPIGTSLMTMGMGGMGGGGTAGNPVPMMSSSGGSAGTYNTPGVMPTYSFR